MFQLLGYLNGRQRLLIGVAFIFIITQIWLDLRLPDFMADITELIETEGSEMSDILIKGGFMLLCAFGSMLASIIVGYCAARVAAGLSKTLRDKVYDKTIGFSMSEIGHFSVASLINRTTNDVMQIQHLVAMGLQAIVKAPLMAVWAIVKIYNKSWQWTSATAVAVFVLIILLAAVIIFAHPRFIRIQGLTDNINRVTRELLSGIRVVRAYNAEKFEEDKFAQANDELTNNNLVAHRVMSLMGPGTTLINSGLTLAVYWIGAYMILAADQVDRLGIFSDMVVFSNYAMQVIMSFMMLNMIFMILPRSQVSANRICEVLNMPVSIEDGKGVGHDDEHKGSIEFKNVSFRYPGAGENTLFDISFKAEPGETVAFIGATGSGKTSLINLIPRFYDVTEGEVLVDGRNVKEFTQCDLHERIGYVPQKAVLFAGTVASNVNFGTGMDKDVTEEDIKEAIDTAQCKDFVEKMEGQYEAPIAQGGTNVSGGQKQRLSIAR
ncbi:MAG: ABC transporter ATP-binding protein, partial [Proteobacteria bacterium]|nr:ABC transporter ATP-binding protein [Pseudomonadota bacterium]